MARAARSLPVPLSPVISTLLSTLAARGRILSSSCVASLTPTMAPRARLRVASARSTCTSRRSEARSRALLARCRISSIWKGFVTKSKAPRFIASTATSMVPNAVITITSVCRQVCLIFSRRSRPVASCIRRSVITRSNSWLSSSANAPGTLEASTTVCSARLSAIARLRRNPASSSTTRILALTTETHDHGGPPAEFAVHANGPSVIVDDPLHDRQTEAGPHAACGEERVEDLRQRLRLDAEAVVGDGHFDHVAAPRGRHADLACLAHGLRRVQEEVPQYLVPLRGIGPHDRRGGIHRGH